MKSLELFEQNFDILIDEIEKDYKRKKRAKTTKITKKFRQPTNNEEKIISLTNMEMISDFYEYTENCMRLITELESKDKQKNKIPPRDFIFEDNLERKKIAIFDLDETLIHCVGDIRTKKNEEYQQKITVTMPTKNQVQIGINIRPHWKKSIREIKKKYYIVVYTASHNNYADAVLDFLDPENSIFEGRLYRKDCIQAQIDQTKFYVKDLDIFQNFNLKDIVIIDNSVLSFAYHLNNGIPIVPYYDSKEDSELIILSKYLLFIADSNDCVARPLFRKAIH
jgi:CTD small phosphatase-like protein 2